MSNRRSRAIKRSFKYKMLEAQKNEKKRLLDRLISWFRKEKRPVHRFF